MTGSQKSLHALAMNGKKSVEMNIKALERRIQRQRDIVSCLNLEQRVSCHTGLLLAAMLQAHSDLTNLRDG